MREQDTPLTFGGDDGDDADDGWDPVVIRDPQTGRVDHGRSLAANLDGLIASKPAAHWDAQPWQAEFLPELVSPVTGETCAARVVVRFGGEARGTLEFRPGQTNSPVSETQGPQLMWFLTVGRRKPRGYVGVEWALATAMGLRRRDLWDNRWMHEWLTNGDPRALRRLWELQSARDRDVDEFWETH